MGVRGSAPYQDCVLDCTSNLSGFADPVSSSVAPYLPFALLLLRQPRAIVWSASHRGSSVHVVPCKQGPHCAGYLVSQCNDDEHAWLACEHACEPGSWSRTTTRCLLDERACADDEEATCGPFPQSSIPRQASASLWSIATPGSVRARRQSRVPCGRSRREAPAPQWPLP